jgi:hypothetical protein
MPEVGCSVVKNNISSLQILKWRLSNYFLTVSKFIGNLLHISLNCCLLLLLVRPVWIPCSKARGPPRRACADVRASRLTLCSAAHPARSEAFHLLPVNVWPDIKHLSLCLQEKH